jgi:hypothetical protein
MPLLGNSLPATWRPFLAESPWNSPIESNAQKHPDSDVIMAHMLTKSSKLAMSRNYTIPVWVVDHRDMDLVRVRSDRIFDWWDTNRNGISDVGVPWTPAMWAEQTSDGHISIVDPTANFAWEMSRFKPPASGDELPTCTTFNQWNLKLEGYGDPNEGDRWTARGGRGSGFPEIAGLMRIEQIQHGEINHALVFTFPECRKTEDGSKIFMHPPACRSDGDFVGVKYPIEGMRFQLVATEADFTRWGLSAAAKVVARALVKFGMFLCDKGGAWKIQPQLLDKTIDGQIAKWGGLYSAIEKIPTNAFRIVKTVTPTVKKG